MPAVFVHGVPETPAIWDALRRHLHRDDVITLQLPGFGCPRPANFGATKEDYVSWLVAELEAIKAQGPIDLVGHDWGGGFVVRLVSTRADLVRSWMTDIAGLAHVDFEWHFAAQMWQTPGTGEQFFEGLTAAPPDARGALFETAGLPHDDAAAFGRPIDQTMAECILTLYRSAVDVGREWAPEFHDIPAPGCVLLASDDSLVSADLARLAAARAGARITELTAVAHWWMLQDPAQSAAAIEAFWATLS